MYFGKAIKMAMKSRNVTQEQMAKIIGAKSQSVISERLRKKNVTLNNVIEMLDAIGYEMVIQEKKPGRRPEGQLVITLESEE